MVLCHWRVLAFAAVRSSGFVTAAARRLYFRMARSISR